MESNHAAQITEVLLNNFVLGRRLHRFCLLLLWSKSVGQRTQSDLRDVEALALLP